MSAALSLKHVIVVIPSTGLAGRDLISGVFDFARRGKHWDIHLIQEPVEFSVRELESYCLRGLDGIIASFMRDDDVLREIINRKIPFARIGLDSRLSPLPPRVAIVHNNESRICTLAAEHLASLGSFRSFAYIPLPHHLSKGQDWNALREKAFQEAVLRLGKTVEKYEHDDSLDSAADQGHLAEFLLRLPKPAAVMAAWDQRAAHVLSACTRSKISVPKQVAVIGVDNDEIICDFTEPQLTSVRPNHIKEGYEAAAALSAIMDGRKPKRSYLLPIEPMGIVIRDSTKPLSPASHLLHQAIAYIEATACNGIKPKDVAAQLRISRRLLDMRFRQYGDRTLNETILEAKFKSLLHLLRKTNRPISTVASASGFHDIYHLTRTFKTRYGMTMSQWRAKHRQSRNG